MSASESRSEVCKPAAGDAATSRIGLRLFWVYVLLYAGFMGLVLLRPEWLATRPFGGVNLAIAYGLGLILAALVLSLVYMAACRVVERRTGG